MKISRFSVQHPVIIGMILLALAVFGIVSIYDVNIEFMSDINIPQVYVISVYPGASSQDIEETVIDVMEDNFVTLEGFSSMESQASNSVGVVILSFQDGYDAYDMLPEVRNRISEMESSLPSGLSGTPTAIVGGASMLPIFSFTVSTGGDIANISEYVSDELVPEITKINGVSTVSVSGNVEPEVDITLDVERMSLLGISPLQVYQVLSFSNMSIPLATGEYQGSEISIRYDGSYDSLSEIESLPVGSTESGKVIRLSDVATISFGYPERDYHLTSYGEDVVLVEVSKRGGENTLSIINSINEILERESARFSGSISFSTISDDSQTIVSSLSTVIESGIMGILIAVIVIFVFLNDLKATLVIALSIPLSVFFTFIGMRIAGISVNLMSISGIVVSLGSIVDASIVVLDQIYKFYQKKTADGTFPYTVNQSIFRGTDIVDKSVIGSNLTTVIVFIPLAMLSGIVGMILYPVSMTFMISIGSSLIVAIIFIPFFLKLFLPKDEKNRRLEKESFIVKGLHAVERWYKRFIGSCIEHSTFVVVAVLSILLLTVYLFFFVGFAFIPSTDNSDFYINITFPYGYTLEKTDEAMAEAERIMLENVPELKTYVMYSGKSSDMLDFSQSSTNKGSIHAVLVPVADRERDIHDIIIDLQYRISSVLPGATVQVKNGGYDNLVSYISGGGGYGLTLVGDDSDLLYQEARRIEDFLKSDSEVLSTSINSNYDTRTAILNASYENMSNMGITSYEAGMTTAILFNGIDVGLFSDPESGKNYNIRLESDITDEPVSRDMLNDLHVVSQAGANVSFSSIADFDIRTELSQINHTDRARTVTVSAQLVSESTSKVTERVNEYLAENPLDPSITTKTGGMGELLNDSIVPMMQAGLIGLFLVYMVMVLVFERFKHPILIMLTIPFCAIGVFLSLSVFGSSLNMVSIMGIITLFGMLVNNGIILVDYINQLQEEKRAEKLKEKGIEYDEVDGSFGLLDYDEELDMLKENIKEGTTSRLRPILMSSLTTILGVIPMAIARGEGAEVYAPLGQVIMGGLTTSTFITLVIMPIFYFRSERRRMNRKYQIRRKK